LQIHPEQLWALGYIFVNIMLTSDEKAFIEYWEANRGRQKKIRNQWIIGLPAGIMIGMPILLSLFSRWNNQVQFMRRDQFYVLLIAVGLIISFIAIFTIRHKWDLREQHYRELLEKQKRLEKEIRNQGNLPA
jgi:hypothetical protein